MRSTPGADTAHFIYGTDPHTPDMMVYDDCSNGVTSSDVYRLLRDERGSVRLVIRVTNGEVIQRVDYGPWGEPTRVLPSSSVSTMVVQPFGFAGGIWMPEAQLWHFGARDLDPTTGRWTTKDPILFEGGYNLYMYVTNDPVNVVDPTGFYGLESQWDRYSTAVRPPAGDSPIGYDLARGLLAGAPGPGEAHMSAYRARAPWGGQVVPGTNSEHWRNAEHYLDAYTMTCNGRSSVGGEVLFASVYAGYKFFIDADGEPGRSGPPSPPTFDEWWCSVEGAADGAAAGAGGSCR